MSSLSQRWSRHYNTEESDPISSLVESFFSSDRGSNVVNRLSGLTGDIKVDSKETKDSYIISADLPGINKEDVKVSLSRDRFLTIEAERKEEREGEDGSDVGDVKMHWTERTFGHVHRSFRLPRSANLEDCQCKFDNGVLRIKIGKKEPGSERNYVTVE